MTPTTPCAAVGQEDIYGIGIRLGLYLQWYSTCLAYLYQPQEARSFIVINYSFSTAVAIAGLVYRQAIHSHEIMILAILLMLPLTVIVAAMLNRTLRWLGSIQQHDPKKTPKPYNLTRKLLDIASLVLTTFLLFMAAWELFIEVNKAAIVPSCQPMFIWSYYISGLYPGFVKSVCVAFTLFAPAPIVYIMFSKLHMKSDEPSIVVSLVIAKIETIIKQNEILEMHDLRSTGQLIPLTIGLIQFSDMTFRFHVNAHYGKVHQKQ